MLKAWTWLESRFSGDEGASLVEYALLLVLIAVVAIFAISQLGGTVTDTFNEVDTELSDTLDGAGGGGAEATP